MLVKQRNSSYSSFIATKTTI